jgi:hypothetical protein
MGAVLLVGGAGIGVRVVDGSFRGGLAAEVCGGGRFVAVGSGEGVTAIEDGGTVTGGSLTWSSGTEPGSGGGAEVGAIGAWLGGGCRGAGSSAATGGGGATGCGAVGARRAPLMPMTSAIALTPMSVHPPERRPNRNDVSP